MSLTPSLTQAAWQLVKSRNVPEAEAVKLSQMLSTREELTAAMLLSPEIFQVYPDLRDVLSRVAKANFSSHNSPRELRGNAKMERELANALAEELGTLIQSETERKWAVERAHSAFHAHAKQQDSSRATLGYQWWIASESS